MYNPEILPSRIKQAREARGLSQYKLGELLGVHITTVNKYEIGKNHPNAEMVAKIANILKVNIEFFFADGMKISDAFEETRTLQNRIDDLSETINQRFSRIENRVAIKPENQLFEKIQANYRLKRICDLIKNMEGVTLDRVYDVIYGFIAGLDLPKGESDQSIA